jgi:hypothetical protein
MDAARQDRFLRQLVPSRWEEVEESEVAQASWFDAPIDPVDEGQGDGSPSRDNDDGNDGEQASQPPPPAPNESSDTPSQSFQPWPWMQADGPSTGGREGGTGDGDEHVLRTGAPSCAGDAPPWLGDIVQQISQLSEAGDARFQHWSITVPLDPQALPDCELRMTLSPGALALRFRTASQQSAALVCRHREKLRAQLEALPSSPPAIDIDLE